MKPIVLTSVTLVSIQIAGCGSQQSEEYERPNGYVIGRTGKGVSPFRYARDENDSLWRETDAGGIAHSNIRYEPGTPGDERTADRISPVNYFENFKYFMENVREDKPFFFWYGASEPHRAYEQDSSV